MKERNQKVSELESALSSAQSTISQLSTQLKAVQNENDSCQGLSHSLAISEKEKQDLTDRLKDMSISIQNQNEILDKLESCEANQSQAQSMADEYKNKLADCESSNDVYAKSNAQNQATVNDITTKLVMLQLKADECEANNDALMEKITKVTDDANRGIRFSKQEAIENQRQIALSLQISQEQVSILEKERNKLRQELRESNELRASQKKQLEEEIDRLGQQIADNLANFEVKQSGWFWE